MYIPIYTFVYIHSNVTGTCDSKRAKKFLSCADKTSPGAASPCMNVCVCVCVCVYYVGRGNTQKLRYFLQNEILKKTWTKPLNRK